MPDHGVEPEEVFVAVAVAAHLTVIDGFHRTVATHPVALRGLLGQLRSVRPGRIRAAVVR